VPVPDVNVISAGRAPLVTEIVAAGYPLAVIVAVPPRPVVKETVEGLVKAGACGGGGGGGGGGIDTVIWFPPPSFRGMLAET